MRLPKCLLVLLPLPVLLAALCLGLAPLSLQRALVFSDGVSTCFARIQQSFVSKMMGLAGQEYLERTFFEDTEECFSQAIAYMERHFGPKMVEALGELNALNTDIHWFHRQLPDGGHEVLARKFGQLEAQKDDIAKKIKEYQLGRSDFLEKAKLALYVLAALTVMLVGGVILRSLFGRPRSTGGDVPAPQERPAREWDTETVVLGKGLGEAIDRLSGKILTSSVELNVEVDKEARIRAREEELLQIFYCILSGLFDREGGVSITGRQVGTNVLLTFFQMNLPIKGERRRFVNVADEAAGIDLKIPMILVRDLGGDLVLEHLLGDGELIAGIRVQLTLPVAPLPRARLVGLAKGKKRDIVKSFKEGRQLAGR